MSPFPDLAALQKEGLALALARGADDAVVKKRLSVGVEEMRAWVEWERRKADYEYLKALVVKDEEQKKKMMMKNKVRFYRRDVGRVVG